MSVVLFWIFSIVTVAGALMAVLVPRIVHAVFALLLCFIGVMAVYALAGADFLAITQLVVYVGGVLVLMAFGILLTGRTAQTLGEAEVKNRPWGLFVGILLFAGLMTAIKDSTFNVGGQSNDEGTTAALGRILLGDYIVAFEFASILLIVALVGAAYLVRRSKA